MNTVEVGLVHRHVVYCSTDIDLRTGSSLAGISAGRTGNAILRSTLPSLCCQDFAAEVSHGPEGGKYVGRYLLITGVEHVSLVESLGALFPLYPLVKWGVRIRGKEND